MKSGLSINPDLTKYQAEVCERLECPLLKDRNISAIERALLYVQSEPAPKQCGLLVDASRHTALTLKVAPFSSHRETMMMVVEDKVRAINSIPEGCPNLLDTSTPQFL